MYVLLVIVLQNWFRGSFSAFYSDYGQRSWSTYIFLNNCYSVSIISYLETTYVLKEDMDGDYEIPKWMQFLAKLADKFERVFHKISVTENDTYQETYHIKPRNTGSPKSYKRRHYVLQEANRAKSVSGEKLLLAQIHSTLQVNSITWHHTAWIIISEY